MTPKLAFSLRVSAAVLVLAAGAVHLYLYFDFFHAVHVIGALFVLNAVAAAVIALALLLTDRPLVAWAGIAYAAGTLGAFFLSVHNGLFGYTERLSGGWQEAALALELGAILVLLPLVAGARQLTRA
jgi:hypothetical protein